VAARRVCILSFALVAAGCRAAPPAADTPATEPDWFTEESAETGLDFVHVNGMSGAFYLPEILAPGVGLLDYDNDGDLDVYVVQGGPLGPGGADSARPAGDRLYRNDLAAGPDGAPVLRFTDVTATSGLDARTYGFGVAAGDYDNDGWTDLYLTRLGPDVVLHNNGDGTFTDVSRAAGIDDPAWSVPAAFVDIDRDGWLDLYVGHYLRYSVQNNIRCFGPSGALDYCKPGSYQPVPDRLYRNRRNGTFEDVTVGSGIGRELGPALGVSTADFDRDGWIDIYVANDGRENQLWRNQRNGTFRNVALVAGAALPIHGRPEASMGVDAGDFDNDGDPDLFMTELTGEGANLFVNDGTGTFSDESALSALGPMTLGVTGFGTAWFDYDNDGWLDLLAVNGDIQIIQALAQAGDPFPFHQRKQLFRNTGGGAFEDVTAQAGAAFEASEVGRGAAFGDLDNDGDTDIVVATNNGPVRLLVNHVGSRRRWVGLRLAGRVSAGSGLRPVTDSGLRDMLGAEVEIVLADGTRRWRRARSDGSYASASDPRVLVGVGDAAGALRVTVHWPDGRIETWSSVPLDRYTTLRQGDGE
jgi:hypothetical protein